MRHFCRPGHRRRAAVWIPVLVVGAAGLAGCTRTVSPGSPVMQEATLSVDPAAVLLDAADVDAAMGISGARVLDQGDRPDDTVDTNPPQCHGVVYIAGVTEYAPTAFTAMGWRIVGADRPNLVVQMVARLPSVAAAEEFVEAQTKAWQACAGKVVVSTDKTSKQTTSSDRITSVRTGDHTVIASQEGAPGQACQRGQHVLQAVSNIILDVNTCGGTVSDPAEVIAKRLADRVHRSG